MTIEELKRYKQEAGFSVDQLSRLSGVPVGTLQKILSGETKSPRYATLQAIEKVFLPYRYPYPGPENPAGDDLMKNASVKESSAEGSFAGNLSGSAVLKEPAAAYGLQRSEEKLSSGQRANHSNTLSAERFPGTAFGKRQGEYRLSDYYALPQERRAELIDGVLYDMSAPSIVHQQIAADFQYAVTRFIREEHGECLPLAGPVDVRLNQDDRTVVQPDFMIVCDRTKIRRWGIMGAPDFVLEIVSQGSIKKDYVIKVSRYIEAGVKELWLIDPLSMRLVIYYADDDKVPYIGPLSGSKEIDIYQGKLVIDLDAIAALVYEYPE